MKTLRFYQVMNGEMVLIDTFKKESSYGVDYPNWPCDTDPIGSI